MVESISMRLEHEILVDNLLGLSIMQGVKILNHSQFFDDTLLLGGASMIIDALFKLVLESFLDATGRVVNNIKCHIVGWNSLPREVQAISLVFQFPIVDKWSSFHYLDIPISLKNSTSQNWLSIMEKKIRNSYIGGLNG
jgi:hypothetical protein